MSRARKLSQGSGKIAHAPPSRSLVGEWIYPRSAQTWSLSHGHPCSCKTPWDMARIWNAILAEVILTIQIHRVLCATDFSDVSRAAFDYAVGMAKWYKARLSVLHVHQLSMPMYGAPYTGPEGLGPIVLTDLERRDIYERIEAYVAEDRAATDLDIDTVVDEEVNVPDAILSSARSISADLLVLGTHGRSGFQRIVLGSIAEKVLRKACCPVLIVPPHVSGALPRDIVSIDRILCPVDFSMSSARALDFAASLAEQAHARLTVLHVVELPPDLSEFPNTGIVEYRNALFHEARESLSKLVKTAPTTCSIDELVLVGRAYRETLRVAAEQGAGLIAMGVQGRGPVDLTFFGSTTNHVVRAAECPVLTLREDRKR